MKLREILTIIEDACPFFYQEPYDNSGLQVGDHDAVIDGILLAIDVTEDVINEAITKKCNLVVSHHPLLFNGIKKLSGQSFTERIIRQAIREEINIISVHTNADNAYEGVNRRICDKLGLRNLQILSPMEGQLLKLAVFVPISHAEVLRESLFSAGAGVIGEYDSCSFNTIGNGTFRGSENTKPFKGEKEKLHSEEEVKIETILPRHLKDKVIHSMLKAHPYEEVAYDLFPLANKYDRTGAGMTGHFSQPMDETRFLKLLKKTFNASCVRHTLLTGKSVYKVAVCGGSGSFLLKNAIAAGAHAFVSGDFKYHQFFEAEAKILVADVGHYESEQFTKDYFYELLNKKIPNFALHLSEVNTNPINYI